MTQTVTVGIGLALILVLGAIAATGAVSANQASPEANRTLSNSTVGPGGTATVTMESTVTGTSGISLTETFSPAFESASITELAINDQAGADAFVDETTANGVVVAFTDKNVSKGDTVRVKYEVTLPATATTGASYSINGSVVSNQTTDLGESQITVGDSDTHPSGLSQEKFTAFAGSDGVQRGDVVNLISAFFNNQKVGNFRVQRGDIVTLIDWFFQQLGS